MDKAMEQIIRARLRKNASREENVHLTREFLQLIMLRILNEIGYFQWLAFVGGTALRMLYQMQRFSEDLDFSLIDQKGYDFEQLVNSVQNHLEKFGFQVEIKHQADKTVHSAYFKFVDLLQQLDISRMKNEKLAIRVEVDSNPPDGWQAESTLINDFFIFPVRHFDLPSLFATKIHACFFRKYLKGRDFYDLFWYLSKKITPNFVLLNNAIRQTEKIDLHLDANTIQDFFVRQLSSVDFARLKKEVTPFLVHRSEADLMTPDRFFKLIESY